MYFRASDGLILLIQGTAVSLSSRALFPSQACLIRAHLMLEALPWSTEYIKDTHHFPLQISPEFKLKVIPMHSLKREIEAYHKHQSPTLLSSLLWTVHIWGTTFRSFSIISHFWWMCTHCYFIILFRLGVIYWCSDKN